MSLPRISWHIGDYLKDTGHLRAAGHGAYFMLCMHYYANGNLPKDDRQLAAIARMSDKEWREHKSIIQAFFHDGWLHKRIDKEIETANEKYLARASAGKKGGEAKANGKQKPSNATNLLEPSQDDATAKFYQPITLTDNLKKDNAANAAVCSEVPLELNESQERQASLRKRKLPENFQPDRDIARKAGWPESRIDQQIQAFFDYARAHNKTYADWQAAWRNWTRSKFQQAEGEQKWKSGMEGIV